MGKLGVKSGTGFPPVKGAFKKEEPRKLSERELEELKEKNRIKKMELEERQRINKMMYEERQRHKKQYGYSKGGSVIGKKKGAPPKRGPNPQGINAPLKKQSSI